MILGLLVISTGCAEKVYVDRPIEVKVPQKVVLPKVECYPNQSTYTEEVKELRLCIERYKQVIDLYNKE